MDNEKILDIVIILVVFLIACGLIWLFFEVKEMLNDYRCTNLPINEFFQDEKCEKYWRYQK